MSLLERPAASTHEVFNQSVPLENYDVYGSNRPLVEAVEREGAGWASELLHEAGRVAGSPEAIRRGFEANDNPPKLQTHDRYGNRVDIVDFHPSWHWLMEMGISRGMAALPWREERAGGHVARVALMGTLGQVEAGFGCPIAMTYAAVPALRKTPAIAEEWVPGLLSLEYDPRHIPAPEKRGLLAGMAMTEKQGGSDVRANTTVARPVNGGGEGAEYEIWGHKWFCSAPMCDVFLVLAQTEEGLSCFVLPRFLPDGTKNSGFQLQRLKDKLGNRSNASSEVEFRGAWARMLGEPGRGVPTIIDMVGHTRLDCASGAAFSMRHGVAQAINQTDHRSAFGKRLADQPLMQMVLADLAVESEAATVTAARLARAYDENDDAFKRIGTAVAKYWLCKRAPMHAAEALECFGGNGYVEASGMPRLYREAPLNSIWEGSGNVICLDVLRALSREPETFTAFFDEVDEARGAEPRLDRFVASLRAEFDDLEAIEPRARRVVERMALALQGSLLVRHGDPAVADAFCASRLDGDGGLAFGTLPPGVDAAAIVDRHRPELSAA